VSGKPPEDGEKDQEKPMSRKRGHFRDPESAEALQKVHRSQLARGPEKVYRGKNTTARAIIPNSGGLGRRLGGPDGGVDLMEDAVSPTPRARELHFLRALSQSVGSASGIRGEFVNTAHETRHGAREKGAVSARGGHF